jgi:hypothetical protein
MEAIKTKYDRILLGLCALTAIVIGALLLLKITSFKDQFAPPPKPGKELANLGPENSAEAVKALEALNTPVKRKPLPLPDGRVAELFVSSPVVKTSEGQEIPLLDKNSPQLRPPIANAWLYDNDLDLTRNDVAELDTDGDGYTNLEEYEGKSNPRNRTDVPPFYTKLTFKECVKEPLSLKFAIYNNGEIQLSRTEPKPPRSAFLRVGEVFPVEPRFKVVKVEMRESKDGGITEQKPVLIIEDSQAKEAPPLEIKLGQTVERPKLSAKLKDDLGNKEFTLSEGDEFELPKMIGTKILVKKITEESVIISFILPGKTERQEHELKIK